jgi:hypothetical protein
MDVYVGDSTLLSMLITSTIGLDLTSGYTFTVGLSTQPKVPPTWFVAATSDTEGDSVSQRIVTLMVSDALPTEHPLQAGIIYGVWVHVAGNGQSKSVPSGAFRAVGAAAP